MEHLLRYIKKAIPFVLGTAVFLFFFLYAPGLIYFQEQNQLFLYNRDYFLQTAMHPGGLASYAGAFFTQFYAFAWSGAFISALLIVLIQLNVGKLLEKAGTKPEYVFLSIFPALLAWRFLCNENYLVAGIVAQLISLGAVLSVLPLRHKSMYPLFAAGIAIVVYLAAGGAFLLYLALVMLYELYDRQMRQSGRLIPLFAVTLLLAAGLPLVAGMIFPYSSTQLFLGTGFYRYPMENYHFQYILWLLVIVTVILGPRLPAVRNARKVTAITFGGLFLVFFLGFMLLHKAIEPSLEEALEYDHMASKQQWNRIIRHADKKSPSTPISLTCLNLALVKTGTSEDKLFAYFQNSTEGLIPSFGGDFTSPLTTAEVFFHLGLMNEAQHYVFEAMEAIPDHQKSARCLKRLAETNFINGQLGVAQKYLGLLKQTLLYRKWALYATEETHPEWTLHKQYRLPGDEMFSSGNMQAILKNLVLHNPENLCAFRYLMAHTLLNKDWDKVSAHYALGGMHYTSVPWTYQQALAFEWFQKEGNFTSVPWTLDETIITGLQEFMKTLSGASEQQAKFVLEKTFRHTYWYYLFFIF